MQRFQESATGVAARWVLRGGVGAEWWCGWCGYLVVVWIQISPLPLCNACLSHAPLMWLTSLLHHY